MTQKDIAQDFILKCSSGQVLEAFDHYVKEEFIHHNAYFAGTKESLIEGMIKSHEQLPEKSFEILQILEDGDRVVLHSKFTTSSEDRPYAVIHIIRFMEGKIIEMWDYAQQEPEACPNDNGIF